MISKIGRSGTFISFTFLLFAFLVGIDNYVKVFYLDSSISSEWYLAFTLFLLKMKKTINRKRKSPKIWRWIVLWLLIFFVWKWYSWPIVLHEKLEIKEWDSFYSVLWILKSSDSLKMKLYLKKEHPDLSKLSQWRYSFSWEYSTESLVDSVLAGPEKKYLSYTILEWWSVYDVDHDLAKKKLIGEWDYLKFVSSKDFIFDYSHDYDFVNDDMKSLEWVLYPDTYYLDQWQDVVLQLVRLQLDTFEKKVYDIYQKDISDFYVRVKDDYGLDFSWYDILKLASVVEKEERSTKNKPIIAWVFLNRLEGWMRLDADITLCYGLREPYETCTPSVIVKWIYDKNNIFNTRVRWWLVPQPIASISDETINAVLHYVKTNNYYYLHDSSGQIHFAETVGGHNTNKNTYLK